MGSLFASFPDPKEYFHSPEEKPKTQIKASGKIVKKGMSKFEINGEIIIALNEKNAKRKYNKKHGY
jgi:hypothetical protein